MRPIGVLTVSACEKTNQSTGVKSRSPRLPGRNGSWHPGQEPFRPGSRGDRLFTPVLWFVFSHALTVRTPIGRMVRQRMRSRGIPLARVRPKDFTAAGLERVPRTAGARGGLPVLDDGRALEVANVIWCTGFVPDFAWIDLPVFAEDGGPVHERGIVRSEPGLYFVGLFFLYAVASSLVGGVGRDAEHIAKYIASREVNSRPRLRASSGV